MTAGTLHAKLKDVDFYFESVFTTQDAKTVEATGNDSELAPAIDVQFLNLDIDMAKSQIKFVPFEKDLLEADKECFD